MEYNSFFRSITLLCCVRSQRNVVHRDLKLGNMMLNKVTKRVILTNFCLGKQLISEDHTLKDQKGSPAYISPDVLSGKFECLSISFN